jgi:uncharacterized protein (DUF488 family)
MHRILTIGHSNHTLERFLALLRGAEVEMLIDVRSMPASRRLPHFNKAALARALADAGIDYAWLGESLGGRPRGQRHVAIDYDEIASRASFARGLDEVLAIGAEKRSALMCAEREPLSCHRTVLVGRRLAERGAELAHIHADGHIEGHGAVEQRLLALHGAAEPDLLSSADTRLAQAWSLQGRKMTAT